jgi:hypothetical protein
MEVAKWLKFSVCIGEPRLPLWVKHCHRGRSAGTDALRRLNLDQRTYPPGPPCVGPVHRRRPVIEPEPKGSIQVHFARAE